VPEAGKGDLVLVSALVDVPRQTEPSADEHAPLHTVGTQTRLSRFERMLHKALIAARTPRERRAKTGALGVGEAQTHDGGDDYDDQLPVLYQKDVQRVHLNSAYVPDDLNEYASTRQSVTSLPPGAKEAVERIQQAGLLSAGDGESCRRARWASVRRYRNPRAHCRRAVDVGRTPLARAQSESTQGRPTAARATGRARHALRVHEPLGRRPRLEIQLGSTS